MKKKFRMSHENVFRAVLSFLALTFLVLLIPALLNGMLTGQILFQNSHIIKSDFWLSMCFLAICFIVAFTLIYWYIMEHHNSDE